MAWRQDGPDKQDKQVEKKNKNKEMKGIGLDPLTRRPSLRRRLAASTAMEVSVPEPTKIS
jgi:hypothetical protein